MTGWKKQPKKWKQITSKQVKIYQYRFIKQYTISPISCNSLVATLKSLSIRCLTSYFLAKLLTMIAQAEYPISAIYLLNVVFILIFNKSVFILLKRLLFAKGAQSRHQSAVFTCNIKKIAFRYAKFTFMLRYIAKSPTRFNNNSWGMTGTGAGAAINGKINCALIDDGLFKSKSATKQNFWHRFVWIYDSNHSDVNARHKNFTFNPIEQLSKN